MSRADGPNAGKGAIPLARERNRVLEALGRETLTGSVVFRRMRERSNGAGAVNAGHAQPGDESLLYPALHSLEAGWKLQATWQSDAGGTKHRAYRKRRLLPRPLGWVVRS
jgi:hypothetical protein